VTKKRAKREVAKEVKAIDADIRGQIVNRLRSNDLTSDVFLLLTIERQKRRIEVVTRVAEKYGVEFDVLFEVIV